MRPPHPLLLAPLIALACVEPAPAIAPAKPSETIPAMPTSLDAHPAQGKRDVEAFVWPVPDGWRAETIPFPLEFAPKLPYHGLEEIRFAPAFFDPAAPGYFSYAFVWWLQDRPTLDQASLERDLAGYFAGLCQAVGGKKHTFNPNRFKAILTPGAGPPLGAPAGAQSFRGTIDAYDPFEKGKGRELTLNIELSTWDCPAAGRRVLMVAASPRPRSDTIWKDLAERVAAFRCQ